MLEHKLEWVSMTPLGGPVVPLIKTIKTIDQLIEFVSIVRIELR